MNNTLGTSVTPQVDKPKLIVVTPYSKKLHASISSHFVPQPKEFNVVNHSNVIAHGMFKIDPSQTSRILIDRFKARLSSWKANLLSIGGHLTLIKSVLGSLVTKAPRNFHGSNTLASFDKGGLGVGSLSAFNKGLLLKWK
nr:RNA-directed DNA polymerase, eukaryota, reverse transcriptase zinc-binding domain protein [Tanacetum cinerariifolium]